MSRFAWVTFDCYGTLIDWDAGVRNFLRDLLTRKGVTVDLDALHRRWEAVQFDLIRQAYRPYKEILRLSLEAALKEFGIPYAPEDGDAFAASMPTWQPFPDVPPTLHELKRHARIAIISNTDNDILRESVRLMGVVFDALITAEDARVYKPDLRIFAFALERLGEAPDRILHVAFGFHYDLAPAKQVGMVTCWLNRTGEPKPEGVEPDFIVGGLPEVCALLSA
ncbi:(S)-2-haloacid dehalogenase 4A [bacterium HR17]|jgi:2-haloalkanoic acid dehalogenase type II|uniref:(S)-2-haloacid dehalogenase 4A n=1 Tax=Candidatus Fervidibacter japonicus TaxID=2035412 RepID=A0A2H5XAY3_9BACT|nr:(S)-2-haloacid dehalogenase 4A [bacterium HR17]